LAVEVQVATATTDVHSGMAGGAVQNPARSLAQLLSTMWHRNNSIAVAGWYDNVREISEGDRCELLQRGGALLPLTSPASLPAFLQQSRSGCCFASTF
jgi:hypothetical protein